MSELKQHNSSLDAVRALAILLVLAAHGSFLVTGWLHGHGVPSYWLSAPAGCCGVEIFFCLSGYLIGRVLLDLEAAPSALRLPATRTFLIRRWMRTLPLYYIALDAYLFFPALDPAKQSGSWAYIVFGQNLLTPMPASNWFGPSWSLVIEEWSYVVLPLLAFVVFRKARHKVFLAACCAIIAGLLARLISAESLTGGGWDTDFRKVFITRIDAIAYGVLIAAMMRGDAVRTLAFLKKIAPLTVVLVLLVLWFFDQSAALETFYGRVFLFSAIGISFASLLPLLESVKLPDLLAPAARFVARISYAAYLTHWGLLPFVRKLPKGQMLVYLVGTVSVSMLLSYLIEYPIMRRRPKMPATR